MLRAIAVTSIATLVLLSAPPAGAAPTTGSSFGEQGEFILGVDRLVPVLAYQTDKTSVTTMGTTTSSSDSRSSIDFLQNPFGVYSGNGPTFYNMPRLGLDYVLLPNFTIGGNVIVGFSLGGTHETVVPQGNNTTRTTDTSEPSYTLFGLAPRAGYIFALNDLFAFWPRAGLSFYSLDAKTTNTDAMGNTTSTTSVTYQQWAIDVEGLFVWTPLPHFGVTGGPMLDIPITGSANTSTTTGPTTTTQNQSFSSWHLGLNVGIVTYF